MKTRIFILIFMCMAFITGVSADVRAQETVAEIEDPFQKELPEYDFLPGAEFQLKTDDVSQSPAGHAALEYNLRVPKGWMSGYDPSKAVTLVPNVMREFAAFESPPGINGIQSSISLKAQKLDVYSSADFWLRGFLKKEGVSILGYKQISTAKTEVLYVKIIDDITYIVRAIASVNGTYLVFAQYFLPQIFWQDDRALQDQIMDGLSFPVSDHTKLENLKGYQFLQEAYFQYPDSWDISPRPIKTLERMNTSLQIKGKDEKLKGLINIHVIKPEKWAGLEQELAALRKYYGNLRLEYDAAPSLVDRSMITGQGILFGVSEQYNANVIGAPSSRYDIRIGLLSSAEHYFIITMLSVRENDEYLHWVKNMNAYRNIFATISSGAMPDDFNAN